MSKETLIKQIEETEQSLKVPKEKLSEENSPKLHLVIIGDSLHICYKGNQDDIGFIDGKGRCNILSLNWWVDTYEQWRSDGMPTCHDEVEFLGSKYKINDYLVIENSRISFGRIYSLDVCKPVDGCRDTNIKRHKHNNCPIIF